MRLPLPLRWVACAYAAALPENERPAIRSAKPVQALVAALRGLCVTAIVAKERHGAESSAPAPPGRGNSIETSRYRSRSFGAWREHGRSVRFICTNGFTKQDADELFGLLEGAKRK